jgi:hypothetical protein
MLTQLQEGEYIMAGRFDGFLGDNSALLFFIILFLLLFWNNGFFGYDCK